MRSIVFDVSVPRILATQVLGQVWSSAWRGPSSPVSLQTLTRGPLAPRHVRLRNQTCGICASDLHLLFVDLDPRVHPAALPGNDRIYLGHEVLSHVTRVGAQVTELSEGDRVLMRSKFLKATCLSVDRAEPCVPCQHGEYALCQGEPPAPDEIGVGGGWGDGYDAHPSELWKVPDWMSPDQATLIEPLACSVRAVLRQTPQPGERALVLGCGTIGLGVIAALRAISPDSAVFAMARYPQQIQMAEELGAEVLRGELLRAARATTGGQVTRAPVPQSLPGFMTRPFGGANRTLLGGGFDVVYDCVASSSTLEQSLRITRPEGTVVMVGVNLQISELDLTPVLLKQIDLVGAMSHGMETFRGARMSTFDVTARLIEEGLLPTTGFITHRFPLDHWQEAVSVASNKHTGCIKVVFEY